MGYAASWSGGKDGCLACYKAILRGYEVSHLLNFVLNEPCRPSVHEVSSELTRLQSQAIGIPLLQVKTTWVRYEDSFRKMVARLIPLGLRGVVFGDIYLTEHKAWAERVCRGMGLEAVEPLWGEVPERVLLEFMRLGFEAIIIGAKSDLFGKEWVGRRVDGEFYRYLKDKGIDFCGENGEYHTAVIDGPLFRKGVQVTGGRTVLRNGLWILKNIRCML
jgi:uncharacterized protein (TIGR00290 family)